MTFPSTVIAFKTLTAAHTETWISQDFSTGHAVWRVCKCQAEIMQTCEMLFRWMASKNF
jgi:hypothetical protein